MLLQVAEKRIEPDITLVELAGKLALGRESQRVEAMVEELAQKGQVRVIFDMTGVTYVDSAGIGLVALAAGTLKEAGGKLVVVTGAGRVLDLLKITQMNQIVNVCSAVPEAVSLFGATQPPASA